jgi:hypothetical protein
MHERLLWSNGLFRFHYWIPSGELHLGPNVPKNRDKGPR